MSGVHRLDQRQHFVAAHFADDDPVGSQPEGGAHEIGKGHRRRAVGERGPRLETNGLSVSERQLTGVLDHEDAFVGRGVGQQCGQERGLAGRRGAGDHHVATRRDDLAEQGLARPHR